MTTRILAILSLASVACTSTEAWISKKTKTGGRIAYAEIGTFTTEEEVLADFKKAAKKLCHGKEFKVEKQYVPPPDGIVPAVKGEKSGMFTAAVSDHKRKEGLLFKNVPWEYSAKKSLDSWHEAEVRCKK